MTRELVLSASSVDKYLRCELAWWFAHVAKIPGESSWERILGQSVHGAVENALGRILQLKPFYEPAASNITDESHADLDLRFDREASAGPVRHGKLGYVEAKKEAHKALAAYWAIFPPTSPPWLVELPFEIDVDGIPYSGTIDRVDERGDDIETDETTVLRDLKTVASRPPAGKYRLNMIGYWLGLHVTKGVEADAMVLDYIVRTKTPYHWPEWRQAPDEDDLDWFAATLANVAEGIAAGRYRPTGLDSAWECKVCEYRNDCGPYQRLKEVHE